MKVYVYENWMPKATRHGFSMVTVHTALRGREFIRRFGGRLWTLDFRLRARRWSM